MNDLISRKAAINGKITIQRANGVEIYSDEAVPVEYLKALPPVLNNQVNLCDSCTYIYPECPSKKDDVIFGNGIGNDNICACNKYQPIVQLKFLPEHKKGKWIKVPKFCGDDVSGSIDNHWSCSECNKEAETNSWGFYILSNFCPNCGADMRGE